MKPKKLESIITTQLLLLIYNCSFRPSNSATHERLLYCKVTTSFLQRERALPESLSSTPSLKIVKRRSVKTYQAEGPASGPFRSLGRATFGLVSCFRVSLVVDLEKGGALEAVSLVYGAWNSIPRIRLCLQCCIF
jgi:hypothetical protein